MMPHIGNRFSLTNSGLSHFQQSLTPIQEQNSLLRLGHRAVALAPAVLAQASGLAVATGRASALLFVVGMSAAASATHVRGLLLLAHAWSTLGHDDHLLGQRGDRPACYERYPR